MTPAQELDWAIRVATLAAILGAAGILFIAGWLWKRWRTQVAARRRAEHPIDWGWTHNYVPLQPDEVYEPDLLTATELVQDIVRLSELRDDLTVQLKLERDKRIRAERAKHRHWSTIRRLKGQHQ